MENNKRNILVVLIAAVIGVAVLASFGMNLFSPALPPIVLPTPAATDGEGDNSSNSDSTGLVRVEVTPETVQSVIATLARPDSYYRVVTLEDYWEGGQGTTTARVWVDGGWTRTEATWSSGTVRISIVGDGTVWWWYSGDREAVSAPADGRSADLEGQRIPTYEDVLDLDKDLITDAGYESKGGLSCIYVEVAENELGCRERYWVAEESGLLVAAETLEGEKLVSSMSSYAVERPVPPDTSYELPDGTVLHTTGVS